jgi:LAO/AO transport system kinase
MIPRDPAELVDLARDGSRTALARLLTYVESGGPNQLATAALAYRAPPPYVVGITGPPGAGKSTLTDRLIATALEQGSLGGFEPFDQLGILCIDPTSPFTGGAILGDRIRMQGHATNERVFIRSMATRGHLGGLSLAVPDAVRVLGAARFRLAVVETVGVGQMEVDIASAADTTVVVTNPGWGDSMQANKAGLLEVADIFVINKADRAGVRETRRDLEQMLDLGGEHEWRPLIVETIATDGTGTDGLWEAMVTHRQGDRRDGPFARDRPGPRQRLRGPRRRPGRRHDRPVPGGRGVTVGSMIATSVAYDLVFLIHVLAGVATLGVLLTMRWSAQLVARGADGAVQQARFPQQHNWAARVIHLVPITGLILSLSGANDVALSKPWVGVGILCYLLAAGHLEARALPLERTIGVSIHRDGVAVPESGRKLVRSIDVLLAIVAVAFVAMLTQF